MNNKTYSLKEIQAAFSASIDEVIQHVRIGRAHFRKGKKSSDEHPEDVTNLDQEAERIHVSYMERLLKGIGGIYEEGTRIETTLQGEDASALITGDAIDGTSNLVAMASWGVMTQLSFSRNGRVLIAYIANIFNGEIYRAFDGKVTRQLPWEKTPTTLHIDPARKLADQHILTKPGLKEFSKPARDLFSSLEGTLQTESLRFSTSIGWVATRLANGEIGGFLQKACEEPVWDYYPVIGLLPEHIMLEIIEGDAGPTLRPFTPIINGEPIVFKNDTLIVHRSRYEELSTAIENIQNT